MNKFALTTVCTLSLASFVLASEFDAVIINVDGGTASAGVSYYRVPPPKRDYKKEESPLYLRSSTSVKVAKGQYNSVDMKWSAGEPLEGGLNAPLFKNIDPEKGVYVHITVADDGVDKDRITQILVVDRKKKKSD